MSDADWIYNAEAVTGGLCVGPCEKEKAALARVRELEAAQERLRAECDRQLGRHLCYTSYHSREKFWHAVDKALAAAGGAEGDTP